MDFNGNPTGAGRDELEADLNANGFGINNLLSFNMIDTVPPAPPITSGTVTYFTDTSDILNSIDDLGTIRTYVTGVAGIADRIEAPDLSCSIICNPGGVIDYDATDHLFQTGTIQMTSIMRTNPLGQVDFNTFSGVSNISMNDTVITAGTNTINRIFLDPTVTLYSDATGDPLLANTQSVSTKLSFGIDTDLTLNSTDCVIRTNTLNRLSITNTATEIADQNGDAILLQTPSTDTTLFFGTTAFALLNSTDYRVSTGGTVRIDFDATESKIFAPDGVTEILMSNGLVILTPDAASGMVMSPNDVVIVINGNAAIEANNTFVALYDAGAAPVFQSNASDTFTYFNPDSSTQLNATEYNIIVGSKLRTNFDNTASNILPPLGTGGISINDTGTVVSGILTNEDIRGAGSPTASLFFNGTPIDVRFGQTTKSINTFGTLTNNGNPIPVGLFAGSNATTTVTGTTESDFFTGSFGQNTILANTLTAGSILTFTLGGVTNVGGSTLRIRVRGGAGLPAGAILTDTGVLSISSFGAWTFTATINITIAGAAGVAAAVSTNQFFNVNASSPNTFTNTTTVDTTINNTITVTAQYTLPGASITRNMGYCAQLF